MARKRKRQRKTEESTFLSVLVDSYEAHVEACVNHVVYAPQLGWLREEGDHLFEFKTRLQVTGTSRWPEERAGDTYELTIYGEDAPSSRLHATLKDAQKRDKYGAPQYRTYRGSEIPVYEPPKGVGTLDKVRGEPRWSGWLFAKPCFVRDALVLLGHGKPVYLAINERKEQRRRWLQSVALQTAAPEDE